MSADSVLELPPAYPGFDAGLHGHWALRDQNSYSDGHWQTVKGVLVVE